MALRSQQLDHFRRILVARREELARGTIAAERGVNEEDDLAHLDPSDRATASIAKDDLLGEAARSSATLAEVEAALDRIGDGSYGRCTECDREIPLARLEAVPWTPYCIQDQEIADRRREQAETVTGGAPSRVAK